MIVLKSFLFFVGAAAACAFIVLCLWVDMRFVGHDIPELSLTEIMQETVLATIVFLHFRLAKMDESMRYCNILVGGFFLTMLIRELDALFDLISHGSWVWFALITALLALIRPVMHFRATLEQLAKYTQSPWYGILLSGLLAVLVFSRLFGMQVLWHDILEHGYMRVVKNAVEEGSESFGYMLCLAASLGYYVTFRTHARQKQSLRAA
ncbi:transporter [Enterobacter hormaechei]|uniref:transporter n=1 Tax=Enterobacter hormaechei TaxID=158836 RepID=UPI00125860AF|nr:transporter [Enterobacter hormaechei]VAL23836.1 Uncharacterised protein [Enterobacter hormaechei]